VHGALDVLTAGIDSSDPVLASEPIGEHFFMGGNVATRYTVDWDTNESAPAVGRFRIFFDNAFARLVNTRQQFTVSSVDVNGALATVNVQSRFDAVRTDSTPAENVTYDTADYMLFELQNGSWRLVRWDEQPLATPKG
jgi:hypothetical protein